MSHSATVELARELVRRRSETPDDAGCQTLLSQRLAAIGFTCEQINFHDVTNLWATRGREHHQTAKPLVVFAGHTDVVPTGPLAQWSMPPFDGAIKDGMLHGRGAADMKGSIACFVTACERFVEIHNNHSGGDHNGAIGLLITSDEEGVAKWGTQAVIAELDARKVKIDMCIVGEPTSSETFGDTVKVGRRGSINGKLIIRGKQGHIAYPHLAVNPLHTALPALADLVSRKWEQDEDRNEDQDENKRNQFFPPTGFQLSNINGGTGASNVIPGEIRIDFNFRYSPQTTDIKLKQQFEAILCQHHLDFEIQWGMPGYPYQTKPGALVDAVVASITEVTGRTPTRSTAGGTSDGRFIAPSGAQVVEFGPINATIHQINEQVSTTDLDLLSACYENILTRLLAP
ncbi:succinyl-diaminopimelate desuccinylase [Candidatus Spongiihabitans sp.]|uniref:succinyl-diaminopimelate desuccinylase n=1 Tax=Candidatus Spongiihabitans sp. TaxID=3101308 RepID=UPI003C7E9492